LATFAFIIHPIDPRGDVKKRFKLLGTYLPISVIHFLSAYFPPLILSQVKGIRSQATGEEVKGWLLACPLTAKRMIEVPVEFAYRKIIATCKLAEKLGVDIIGLGAFTSVVGDAGVTVARSISVPVTTGNSYAVAASVKALKEAALKRGINVRESTVAILGATGSIGKATTKLLASEARRLILLSRSLDRLSKVRDELPTGGEVRISTRLEDMREADLVVTAAGAVDPLVTPGHLKRGAIVCDIAIPSNISPEVERERDDVVILKGGVVEVPGEPDFGFDIRLPEGLAYACMAETIALAMEKRLECYTLGRDLEVEKIREIERIAEKHGFHPVIYPEMGAAGPLS